MAFLVSCGGGGGSSSTTPSTTPTVSDDGNAAVTVSVEADYGSSSSGFTSDVSRSSVPSVLTICTPGAANDDPGYVAGKDCDGDGGVVAYVDPTGFKVAIKRLALVKTDDTKVDLIPDTGTLADSEVLDLSNPVQLNISELPKGTYNGFYAEFYYYDLVMPMYAVSDAEVRIYLSDDDFPAEGSLGNHQGDVKLKDAGGTFGFVAAGLDWIDANLDYVRLADIGGASSDDPETGHDRGLYGNDDLWNTAILTQGADQDIFIVSQSLSVGGITIGDAGGTVTMTFDLDDSWYYEDFDSDGVFLPLVRAVADWKLVQLELSGRLSSRGSTLHLLTK